ncbi:MAG: formylmethanofuran--tetrahydromethanopterin N-formyltransferase [Candidatus Bathyarchaeota archaeon]|nr:MAG: formylmethanofuran--tetrahydromethanopterin N-formyltransferase [Candidatus Bathyarchaeota archaeon]
MHAEVEDTYAEAFEGLYSRVMITADDDEILKKAAEDVTATPSIVIGRIEGGVEKWLSRKETPDGRVGAIIQFWGKIDERKPFADSAKKFELEMSYRIRQDVLVKPFTAIFDALPNPTGKIDTMKRIGHCGDGFEWEEKRYGRDVVTVPLMVPDFHIERYLGYGRGVMGGNFWYMCKTRDAVMEAGRKALKAIRGVEGAITPFNICSAGSKPETKFPWIGPTTNHPYCPTLEKKLGKESRVPEGVNYIPEIVINGISIDAVKEAMRVGISAARDVNGVSRISAGNYGGKIGKYTIHLRELFP